MSIISSHSSTMNTTNSFHSKGSVKDIMKWYESNVECMIKRGIEVSVVKYHKNINMRSSFVRAQKIQ
jgi:hypothetical protein